MRKRFHVSKAGDFVEGNNKSTRWQPAEMTSLRVFSIVPKENSHERRTTAQSVGADRDQSLAERRIQKATPGRAGSRPQWNSDSKYCQASGFALLKTPTRLST
jgi:hypothetical protein